MKKINKLVIPFMVSILTLSFLVGFVNPALEAKAATISTSQKYADAMEPGWNLGNTFDSFDTNGDKGENSWGNPIVTKELIKKIKEQGFNSIRIPFTALMRTGSAPDYKIDSDFLARYSEVVKWALDENLYVMVNLHHDSWNWAKEIDSDNCEAMQRYKAIWIQLADNFKDYSDKVCFESLNEPQFANGDQAAKIKILEKVNTQFYNIVRNSGGNNSTRMLVLPTLDTNDSQDRCDSLYNTIIGFNDPNIIATFHYYGYWPFSVNVAGCTTMNSEVTAELENSFTRMYNNFTSKGIGVICGEYGLLGFDNGMTAIEHGEELKYFEYLLQLSKSKNITMMLWDNGQHMGRTSLTWSDPLLYNIIKASSTSRSSYTQSDRIFVKDENKKEDVSMDVTYNGNTLQGIYNGTEELVAGKDYVCDNYKLTLKGSYINRVIKSDYGVNAILTMKFSKGADWNVYIDHYEKPVLGTGQMVGNNYEIPVEFNGTKLITLEAVYSGGAGAGPNNWTTYKEYNTVYAPDYVGNKVIIKEKFFTETKPGKIIFKLHFQSGEILQFSILLNK